MADEEAQAPTPVPQAAPESAEAAPEEAMTEEAGIQQPGGFSVGGPENTFLPSGQPVEVAEAAYQEQQQTLEDYQAVQQEPLPPEVPPSDEG